MPKMYEQVNEEQIPFHKWFYWVEDQINQMAIFHRKYNQMIQNRKKPQNGFISNFMRRFGAKKETVKT